MTESLILGSRVPTVSGIVSIAPPSVAWPFADRSTAPHYTTTSSVKGLIPAKGKDIAVCFTVQVVLSTREPAPVTSRWQRPACAFALAVDGVVNPSGRPHLSGPSEELYSLAPAAIGVLMIANALPSETSQTRENLLSTT